MGSRWRAVRWRALERLLLLVGFLGLGSALAMVAYGRLDERRGEREFAELRARASASTAAALPAGGGGALSPAVAAATPRVREGDLLARLAIPARGVRALVRHGVGERTLLRAVGHVPGTALPGRRGNVVLAAHRDLHFRPLREIERGDRIELSTPFATELFTVVATRIVPPDAVEVMAPSREARLTLVTCYPFDYVGNAPLRFVVIAEPGSETSGVE